MSCRIRRTGSELYVSILAESDNTNGLSFKLKLTANVEIQMLKEETFLIE